MTECLSRLLAPMSTDLFLTHYQAREHFYVGRSCPDYYADLLSVGDIDTVLQSSQLPAATLNVVKGGVRCPLEEWSRFVSSSRGPLQIAVPEKLLSLYADGATLILNRASAVLPALAETTRMLTLELGFPTQTNIYITPRDSTGFSKHSDEHDVLILQVAGSKCWRVYPADGSQAEFDLKSGDLLYVPRGMFHHARSRDEDSIHITLGLRAPYGFELIRDLAAMAAERVSFQRPVPPRFAGAEAIALFDAELLAGLQAFVGELKPSNLAVLRHDLPTQQVEAWPGRFADLRVLSRMTPDTIVCRRPEIPAAVKEDGKFLHVAFGGRQVTVPVFMREQLARILADGNFPVREIEGMITSSGKIKFVAEFVRAGFHRIVKI
jgi:hypothetical protein